MILTRRDLYERLGGALAAGLVICVAFLFREAIEPFAGSTLTTWGLNILLLLYAFSWLTIISGWSFLRDCEKVERAYKADEAGELAALKTEREERTVKYQTFVSWAMQNPRTVEELLVHIECEQIADARELAWRSERRETKGPDEFTDLPRLYNWLEAREALRRSGIEPPPLPLQR